MAVRTLARDHPGESGQEQKLQAVLSTAGTTRERHQPPATDRVWTPLEADRAHVDPRSRRLPVPTGNGALCELEGFVRGRQHRGENAGFYSVFLLTLATRHVVEELRSRSGQNNTPKTDRETNYTAVSWHLLGLRATPGRQPGPLSPHKAKVAVASSDCT